MQVDIKLVRQLAELLNETGLTEIEVEDDDRKIRVARTVQAASVAVAAPAPVAAAAPAAAPVAPTAPADHPGALKSPMVGTVYLAASPEAAPFASVGDTVKEGDTIVIIEAMKVMNPITATKGGKVTQVLVANGQPVEYDQPLVVIE
jgi:acetyl-CoA carboxylase biotin carboxyl carrier protein